MQFVLLPIEVTGIEAQSQRRRYAAQDLRLEFTSMPCCRTGATSAGCPVASPPATIRKPLTEPASLAY